MNLKVEAIHATIRVLATDGLAEFAEVPEPLSDEQREDLDLLEACVRISSPEISGRMGALINETGTPQPLSEAVLRALLRRDS